MQSPQDGVLLRAFVGEADWASGHSLCWTIVDEARRAGLAGATVLHGSMSFGHSRRVNDEFNIDAPRNRPAVVEIIDTAECIQAFLPQLDALIGSGLITLERVKMLRCGHKVTSHADEMLHRS
jgi:uncharacterized protein